MSERVIYLVRSWPRLSQTFVLNEILALERRGVELTVFSLARSGEQLTHADVSQVRAPVIHLQDPQPSSRWRRHRAAARSAPLRYLRTVLFCLRHPRLATGYGNCSLTCCLHHAVTVAGVLREMRMADQVPVHLHAHFAHDPAVVGLLVARLTGLPFTFTAHARDLFQTPPAQLRLRAGKAGTVVTCCAAGAAHLTEVVPAQRRPPVLLVHHGVRLDRFTPQPVRRSGTVPLLVSVGRLVEKKGYDDLLRALAVLRRNGTPFTCHVYGDGPLLAELVSLRERLGLTDSVTLMGAHPADVIREALGSADGFVLTSRVTADGDRDGIPNVLVEALACGLGVVTTSAGGITELVHDEHNGLVAPPGDVAMIAHQLSRLLGDVPLRRRLGEEGRRTVENDYDVDAAAEQLALVFRADRPRVSEQAR